MQFVAVLSFLTPATNAVYPPRIWLVFVGPGPFLLLVLRLSALGRNANLAGGFAGRRSWVLVCVFWFINSAFRGLLHVHGHSAMYFSCFTTSTSVRTEPQATSAAPEEGPFQIVEAVWLCKENVLKRVRKWTLLKWSLSLFLAHLVCESVKAFI